MKKLTLFTIFLLFPLTVNVAPKKFKVTFTITFNELSLQQAADKEEEIRERFKEACVIDVELAGVDNNITQAAIDITTLEYWEGDSTIILNESILEYTGDVYCTACGEIYTGSGHVCKEKK